MIVTPDPFWRLISPDERDQGDVFADVPFVMPDVPLELVEKKTFPKGVPGWVSSKRESSFTRGLVHTRFASGLLLSHGCTIDKGGRRVTFALVEKIEGLDATHHDALRAQEMASYVYLPAVPSMGDCYADLRVLVTLPADVLDNVRLAKMTPEAKLLLEAKLIHFYTRINEAWLEENLVSADRTAT